MKDNDIIRNIIIPHHIMLLKTLVCLCCSCLQAQGFFRNEKKIVPRWLCCFPVGLQSSEDTSSIGEAKIIQTPRHPRGMLPHLVPLLRFLRTLQDHVTVKSVCSRTLWLSSKLQSNNQSTSKYPKNI